MLFKNQNIPLSFYTRVTIYDTSVFNSRLISDIDELSVSNPCSILYLTGDFN